ncbi:MAG: methyltransferase domain-containing protein [Myxococcota bacterium]|nr:methyltransferase domain-containing protein [Myxococcota bacterium]
MPSSTPRDDLQRVRVQFDRQAEAYARMRQTTDARALAGLVGLCGAGAGDRVLDVACGPGLLTLAFAARVQEAVGIDATPAFLRMARQEAARRGLAGARFQEGDAEALPFPDGAFDVAACRAAFHHFPRPARVLSEMRRVVRPGGRLLVADLLGSEDPEKASLHDRIERLCDPSHARALPASAFERLFAEAGLEVVAAPRGELAYDAEDWLAHGGPDETTAARIRTLLAESAGGDRADLDVHRDAAGRLRFRHRTAAWLLRR